MYMRLTSGNKQIIVELGRLIGEGKDGRVFEIVKKENIVCNDLVLKVLFDPKVGDHVNALLSPMRGLVGKVSSLCCLPNEICVSDDGKYCLMMKKAEGVDLYQLSYDIGDLPSYERLKIAYQIAVGISILHENHVIHSDIAHANVVVDIKSCKAFVVDIDGGGRILPYIRPRIWGKPDFMAPELWDNNTKRPNPNVIPNLYTDYWSLATLIHYIVTGSLLPFFFLDNIFQITTYDKPWPPPQTNFPNHSDNIEYLTEELRRLGNLSHLLIKTFTDGRNNLFARPTSKQWAKCLRESGLRWAICENIGCENNRESRVATQPPLCPACGDPLKIIGKAEDFDGKKLKWWEILWEKIQNFLKLLIQFFKSIVKWIRYHPAKAAGLSLIIVVVLIALYKVGNNWPYPTSSKIKQVNQINNVEEALKCIADPKESTIKKAVEILIRNRNYPKAKEGLERAAKIYLEWGNSEVDKGNNKKAIDYYEKAQKCDQGQYRNEILEKLSRLKQQASGL